MALGIEATGGVFVPNTSGRVDQGDQAETQAAALHAAGIHHAGALQPACIEPPAKGRAPTGAGITWASRVIDAFEKLTDAGEAVGSLDGKVIDKYEYAHARRTLEWAAECTAKDRYKAAALARAQAAA